MAAEGDFVDRKAVRCTIAAVEAELDRVGVQRRPGLKTELLPDPGGLRLGGDRGGQRLVAVAAEEEIELDAKSAVAHVAHGEEEV